MINVRSFPLVSDQVDYRELETIIHLLYQALDKRVEGDIVELGCYNGTTSLFIQRVLQERREAREFHVYDSFAGLPPKSTADASPAGEQFKAGELLASKANFVTNFKRAGLPVPRIHKGWFDELKPADIPSPIAFAFLDGDFYDSIKTSLHLIEHKLAPGAIVVVDDYQSEALPGAAKAVHEWLTNNPRYSCRPEHSLAIITT